MMKRLMTILFLLATSALAHAHDLPTEENVLLRLFHQVFGLHHLPAIILIVVAGVVLLQRWRSDRE
jgi:hypothetical protein